MEKIFFSEEKCHVEGKKKADQTPCRIIGAAIGLMNETPFDELTINDICEASVISVGSFYQERMDLFMGLFVQSLRA
jgi:hypothetical protein